jgi:GMP synthase-like glutamine amidotransferase
VSRKLVGPIKRTLETSVLLKDIPSTFTCFHWHGDTFSLPANTKNMAFSEACENQLFIYKDQIIGLQFHLECDLPALENMLKNGSDEIRPAKHIQDAKFITSQTRYISENKKLLFTLLDNLAGVS